MFRTSDVIVARKLKFKKKTKYILEYAFFIAQIEIIL